MSAITPCVYEQKTRVRAILQQRSRRQVRCASLGTQATTTSSMTRGARPAKKNDSATPAGDHDVRYWPATQQTKETRQCCRYTRLLVNRIHRGRILVGRPPYKRRFLMARRGSQLRQIRTARGWDTNQSRRGSRVRVAIIITSGM